MTLARRLGFEKAQRLFRRSPPVRRRVPIAEGRAISQTVVSPRLGGIRDGGSASPCPSLWRHPRRQIGPRPLLVLWSYGSDAVQVQEPGSRVKAPRQSQQPHPRDEQESTLSYAIDQSVMCRYVEFLEHQVFLSCAGTTLGWQLFLPSMTSI
ncbi:hypothetical protein PVAP13_3KG242600 [Panicum virgatum]|uniref:Uncharacterized protein n=1 Tax=Panicum virgatum TaxID=38727 RepID=A0A8T0V5U4_PANVG|nr:hypothetical protein PVAP13_3KG242600 [Panicum virgatum]